LKALERAFFFMATLYRHGSKVILHPTASCSRRLKTMTGNIPIAEPLEKVIKNLEEEARMILPGIQALFGFQLIAVFNQRFSELSSSVQTAHFIALLSSALSVLLVLTPAAYHRQVEPRHISERLCKIGTICLTLCLLPLCFGTAIDVFIIGEVLKYDEKVSFLLASLTFAALFSAWFVFPMTMRRLLK
jgi:hypothetical protein